MAFEDEILAWPCMRSLDRDMSGRRFTELSKRLSGENGCSL
jgi:hypothetical protein